jgi:hypothetical protein
MWRFARWVGTLILAAPAGLLFILALPRLQTGVALDRAYPVPVFMTVGVTLPESTYLQTAAILRNANAADGGAMLQRAEALSLAEPYGPNAIELLESGLKLAPASVRGWALYSEQVSPINPSHAAEALTLSFLLGPYEYYVAEKRARQAALLWDALPTDSRELALRQVRVLWTEESLNEGLLRVMAAPGGSELAARAFVEQPEELRAINRLIATERAGINR